MPLPDGSRIDGGNADKEHQFKKWSTLTIPNDGGLAGKCVLDIGANDGFFTLAALNAGARRAVAIDSADWATYPRNIQYASAAWGLKPEVVRGDFRTYQFREKFDVVFFFGVLYHLQDVFTPLRQLRELLADDGVLYIETQMSQISCDQPVFESASDIYPTTVPQFKAGLGFVGLSNYLLPNEAAMRNLASSYDYNIVCLGGPHDFYTRDNPLRRFFKLTKAH
jgi:SAM-dependent methyltransferase